MPFNQAFRAKRGELFFADEVLKLSKKDA